MFTGIILAVGRIKHVAAARGDCSMTIATGKLPLDGARIGDSIAVNGVCLTAVELGSDYFIADVSAETLARTTLQSVAPGAPVNLELALTPTTRMGGHIVSGHVDGIATIVQKQAAGRSFRFDFRVPDALAKYIAEKGSICVDGISLTVNAVAGPVFSVNIVPHTLRETTLGEARVGDKVNIEVDLLARYLERLMQGGSAAECSDGGVSRELLQNCGFASP